MRPILCAGILSMLAGCGSFQLSSGAIPLTPKTETEMRVDNLTCTNQAAVEANTAGNQVQAFALGATIVGAPVAYELEKKRQREAYAKCMTALGYRVIPAAADPSTAIPPTSLAATLPPGWKERPLTEAERVRGIIVYGTDSVNDLWGFVAFAPKGLEPSAEAMLNKRAAAVATSMDGVAQTATESFQIGAQKAFRSTVSGKTKQGGVAIVYVLTAIEGRTDSAWVVAWTTASAFPTHRSTLEAVAQRVTGM